MPIYNPRISFVDLEETRRYAGLANSAAFPENLLKEACAQAKLLIKPKAVWNIYPYDTSEHAILGPATLRLTEESIVNRLSGAVEVAVMAVTIGARLEEEVSNQFSQGAYTGAILLDAAGTAATEQACDQVNALITQHAARMGYVTGKRFSPGYGGWDVRVQPEILDLAQASLVDIGVTASMMLVPRKSVSAVIGIYPYQESLSLPNMREASCDDCQHVTCQVRKETKPK